MLEGIRDILPYPLMDLMWNKDKCQNKNDQTSMIDINRFKYIDDKNDGAIKRLKGILEAVMMQIGSLGVLK